jgi:hypothetical protein
MNVISLLEEAQVPLAVDMCSAAVVPRDRLEDVSVLHSGIVLTGICGVSIFVLMFARRCARLIR